MTKEAAKGVYLRGSTWWIKYRGPRPDGSWGRIRESAETSDRRVAEKLREDRVRESRNDRDGIKKFMGARGRSVTVDQLLDNLESDYETRRLKSIRQMKVHLEHVRQHFGYMRASGISRRAIEAYVAKRRGEEAADATIDRELELLRRAYSLAADDEHRLVAGVPKVPRLVQGNANAREGFVERAVFDALVEELPAQVLRDVALWAWGTGMRKGEILSLTWDGYDRETKMIRLHASKAKTGRSRAIALEGSPELAAVIERRLAERRPGCPLIFHRAGKPVGDFYTTWARAIDRAKLKAFTIHDLRRTAVRNMVRAGVDRATAKLISGHRTDSMFDRYNIQDERDLAQALEKRAAYEASLPKRAAVGDKMPHGRRNRVVALRPK